MSDHCKSCDAVILWAKTIAGKSMPLNAKKTRVLVLNPSGNIDRSYFGHESHFATCTNADAWRKT